MNSANLASSSSSSFLAQRGLKPASELAAKRPHGDRLRYVAGCRCDLCRKANSTYERERQKARAAGDWNGIVDAAKARQHSHSGSSIAFSARSSRPSITACAVS